MSESPRETADRLRRMMADGYDPTDRENEFLILMDRRDAMDDEVAERLDERGKRPPIGRIVTAGYIGSGGAMHHALLQMMAAGATYPVTMEMTQADMEARIDIANFGRLNHDVTLTLAAPPSMGKSMATLVDKRMMTRPAFAPEGNRAERRAGGHTKSKQRLKGLR